MAGNTTNAYTILSMATLREYFDADFNYAIKVHVKLPYNEDAIETVLIYDFSAYIAFLACYVPGKERTIQFFLQLIESMKYGESQLKLDGRITLPSARAFPGLLEIKNANPLEIHARFHGDPEWVSASMIKASTRTFIYSESSLNSDEIFLLKQKAREYGHQLQFRSIIHAEERSKYEVPLAFISHDSRDKANVARPIALRLQKMLCPVWYDEFSLKVGANLRETIESGLKQCKKCILILSINFFSNSGWTKREFDSIFTREILEESQLILPIWYGVTKQAVYDYSPSLLNVKGLNWDELGEEEICRQLCQEILNPTNLKRLNLPQSSQP